MKKKFIFVLLIVGLVLYFYQPKIQPLGLLKVGAQDVPEDNLQFSVDRGRIYFFQPQTGRIFVYQTTTNRFRQLLTLEKLGKDLKQSRSLPVIEIEEEEED